MPGESFAADAIPVKVKLAYPGSPRRCDGFTSADPAALLPSATLAALFTAHGSYANAALGWSKGAGSVTKTYKFSWSFDTTGLDEDEINALQGQDVQANFEWELQNT